MNGQRRLYSVSMWQTVLDCMEERGWDVDTLAAGMSLSDESILAFSKGEEFDGIEQDRYNYSVCLLELQLMEACQNDHRAILSEETARQLEKAFGVPWQFWMIRHENHRQWLIRNVVN